MNNILNPISENIFNSNNIAIVGNSYNVLLNNYGKHIDSIDNIMRINSANINGYPLYLKNKLKVNKIFFIRVPGNPNKV